MEQLREEVEKNIPNITKALEWSSGEVVLHMAKDGLKVIANRKKVFKDEK